MALTISQIKTFYKQFNIKAKLVADMPCGACADVHKRIVRFSKFALSSRRDDVYKVHLVLHELCHILGYDHGKYKKYYTQNCSKKHIRLIGLKAERYTDKMADKMIRSLFPGFPIDKSYSTKEAAEWYKKEYLNRYF